MKVINADITEKKNHLERLLNAGKVMIFVDTRKPHVEVPPEFENNPQLPLNLSYRFVVPTEVFEDHVEAHLTFESGRFTCKIPFYAIHTIRSYVLEDVIVFPDEVAQSPKMKKSPKEIKVRVRPALKMITTKKNVAKSSAKKKKAPARKASSKKKVSHLQLVK